MKFEIHLGATRIVFLIYQIAIKIPRITRWRLFLNGLLANMQERQFSKTGWKELCPVIFSLPGGWLVIMKRARPISEKAWKNIDYESFSKKEDYTIPVENKKDSFGLLNCEIVAIDYGSQ